jgi:protein-S-isoprenylcysteine O-methyltransferase Ste14
VSVGFFYLGRSFGVVAANRGLKVNGPYRLVRHPIYFAHFVTTSGFLVANFSPWNAALFAVFAVCQVARIWAEERVLSATADYAAYSAQVRWRLIPGLF